MEAIIKVPSREYPTLDAAVAAMTADTRIIVTQNIDTRPFDVRGHALTLVGEGNGKPVIRLIESHAYGMISAEGVSLHIENLVLDANGNGRAVWAKECKIRFVNSVIQRGHRDNFGVAAFGGGAELRASDVRIQDCVFQDNELEAAKSSGFHGYGGALFLQGCRADIERTSFLRNKAFMGKFPAGIGGNGGGLFCEYGRLSVSNCEFTGNRVSAYLANGGAILLKDVEQATIAGSTFTENAVTTDPFGEGGAICVQGDWTNVHLKLAKSDFRMNLPEGSVVHPRQLQP